MILSFGHATTEPIASDMYSISEFGLQTFASPILATSIHTLLAFGPRGTKWHNSSGSVEATLPSATLRLELLQSKIIYFCFGLLVELVLPGLYNSKQIRSKKFQHQSKIQRQSTDKKIK